MAGASLRLKALACEVLARQVYLAAAQSPHVVDVELLEKGLHDSADRLRRELQRRIDAVPAARYDAIVLVYGLCNRSTEGLVAREVPLALARAHDCITLYLGSRARYAAEFERHPGTYWYSAEWLERSAAGGATAAGTPTGGEGMAYDSRLPSKFEELVRKYGEDNARYLLEVMGNWRQHYTRAAYISLPCTHCELAAACTHDAAYRARTGDIAARHGWEFAELEGNPTLVRRLLDGAWWNDGCAAAAATAIARCAADGTHDHTCDADDILVVRPGAEIVATFDDRVVGIAKSE